MQRVLLIEDDSVKALNIKEVLCTLLSDPAIHEVTSLVQAINHVNLHEYDYVIIDMAIPSHVTEQGGGPPMSLLSGGLEVILELTALQRSDRCIVVTQFHEVEFSGRHYAVGEAAAAIKKELGCDVAGCIQYSDEDDTWKTEITRLID